MFEKPIVPLTRDETLAGYDRWSASYDAMVNPMVGASAAVLDREPLGCREMNVLELGCGTGRNVPRVMAEGALRYHGIDGSRGMLARAREAFVDARVTFEEADVHGSFDLGGVFDLALVVLVLEHVVDLGATFANVRRALRPDGRIRIVEIHPDLVAAGTVAHFEQGGAEVRFTSTAHTPDALTSALRRSGFDVARMKPWTPDELGDVPKLGKHRGRAVILDVAARVVGR